MDGGFTSDPEMGGATFANFNVDAIQEVQSSSGVMAAEIGEGAAGFTNVITKSGTNRVHGSAFEFVRNAAFDARNYFDHTSDIDPRRIPPFVRNEFGVTNGGPMVLPRIYDGRGQDVLLCGVSGLPPGARYYASVRRPNRRGTERYRYHHASGRHSVGSHQSCHRAPHRPLSVAE
jgi:hypothetical protein